MYMRKNQTVYSWLLPPRVLEADTRCLGGNCLTTWHSTTILCYLFCFNRVWKQLNRWCDTVVLQHQSACIYSEAHLRHSLLFSHNMYSQTTFSLHVGVQHQTSVKRQCTRYLGAKGSSSPCLHKHVKKFPTSHFKTSTALQPFCTHPRYFLEFCLHEFGFLWSIGTVCSRCVASNPDQYFCPHGIRGPGTLS